ncbi:hypothetical protein [Pseudomonas sp. GW101-3H06]|uniref:hypothetical protein n=1 Tax=Pseudomonas sp. GW101-3H06 TaxID=2751347 RepID=UPI001A90E16D|nr:hypothetical protein [Pseudomonas sp. GW101-3H06]
MRLTTRQIIYIFHCIVQISLASVLCSITAPSILADQNDDETITTNNGKSYTPKAIYEIDQNLSKKNYHEAIRLATNLINNKNIPFITPSYPNYVRSLAYNRRAQARSQNKGRPDINIINDDYIKSALLGNLEAVRKIEVDYLNSMGASGENGDNNFNVDPNTIDDILIIGADLGDEVSFKILSENNSPIKHEALEILYWDLLYRASTLDPNTIDAINKYKISDIKNALTQYSIVGDIINRDVAPERDLLTHLLSELSIRHVLADLLGALPRKGKPKPEEEPTVIDGFQRSRVALEKSGLTSAYLLTPVDVEEPAVGVISIDASRVATFIKPGDSISVSCGALSHIAMVFNIDIDHDEILLADPLYQYWNPAANSCIKNFSLKEFKYGLYLSRLKISEITPMITSITTLRKYELPDFMLNIQPARAFSSDETEKPCLNPNLSSGLLNTSKANALNTDLFTWFNFELAETKSLDAGRNRFIFRPKALRFRGYTAVSMQTNKNGCVEAMSLFVRDVRQDDMETLMMLRDLIESFLKQATGADDISPLFSNLEAGNEEFDFEKAKIQLLHQKDNGDGNWSQIAVF